MQHKTKTEKEIIALLTPAEFVKPLSITSCNFKPHPYMVTERHLALSTGMYLDVEEAESKGAKCGHKNCKLSYAEHKSNHVLFISLTRDTQELEMRTWLISIKELLEENKVDGVGFVETDGKFRVLPRVLEPEEAES